MASMKKTDMRVLTVSESEEVLACIGAVAVSHEARHVMCRESGYYQISRLIDDHSPDVVMIDIETVFPVAARVAMFLSDYREMHSVFFAQAGKEECRECALLTGINPVLPIENAVEMLEEFLSNSVQNPFAPTVFESTTLFGQVVMGKQIREASQRKSARGN